MTVHEVGEPLVRYRLRVEDYLLLDSSGAFGTPRTELLDGDVIIMNAEFRPHAYAKSHLGLAIADALRASGNSLDVLIDASVEFAPHDVPLPDIVVTSEAQGEGLVPSATVALLVEVSASTLDKDLRIKTAIYAAAGVPEYWVVDVNARVIHQMWSPAGDAYRERREIAFGHRVDAATIPGLIVATDAL